jgi:hypothetical protein
MNARRLSRSSKRAVFHTQHSTSSVADVVLASFLPRLRCVRSARKIWPFAAQQSGSLFGFSFLRRRFAEPKLPNFLSGFWRADVTAQRSSYVAMAISQMFRLRKAFKVLDSVVGLIAVNVVHLLAWVKRLQPALRYDAVHKTLATEAQISAVVFGGCVRQELSKNFPATRYGVQMVKEAVLNAIDYDANHVASLR